MIIKHILPPEAQPPPHTWLIVLIGHEEETSMALEQIAEYQHELYLGAQWGKREDELLIYLRWNSQTLADFVSGDIERLNDGGANIIIHKNQEVTHADNQSN